MGVDCAEYRSYQHYIWRGGRSRRESRVAGGRAEWQKGERSGRMEVIAAIFVCTSCAREVWGFYLVHFTWSWKGDLRTEHHSRRYRHHLGDQRSWERTAVQPCIAHTRRYSNNFSSFHCIFISFQRNSCVKSIKFMPKTVYFGGCLTFYHKLQFPGVPLFIDTCCSTIPRIQTMMDRWQIKYLSYFRSVALNAVSRQRVSTPVKSPLNVYRWLVTSVWEIPVVSDFSYRQTVNI